MPLSRLRTGYECPRGRFSLDELNGSVHEECYRCPLSNHSRYSEGQDAACASPKNLTPARFKELDEEYRQTTSMLLRKEFQKYIGTHVKHSH